MLLVGIFLVVHNFVVLAAHIVDPLIDIVLGEYFVVLLVDILSLNLVDIELAPYFVVVLLAGYFVHFLFDIDHSYL